MTEQPFTNESGLERLPWFLNVWFLIVFTIIFTTSLVLSDFVLSLFFNMTPSLETKENDASSRVRSKIPPMDFNNTRDFDGRNFSMSDYDNSTLHGEDNIQIISNVEESGGLGKKEEFESREASSKKRDAISKAAAVNNEDTSGHVFGQRKAPAGATLPKV